MVALFLALPAGAYADFTVNDPGDAADEDLADADCDAAATAGTQCTLRAAIQEANDTAGPDSIGFAFPGPGVTTIAPATSYPTITGPTTIDGYSQAGSQPNSRRFGKPLDTVLRVEIDGSSLPTDFLSDTFTFDTGSAPSTVKGLVLNGNPNNAIRTNGTANVAIQGNFIGTNAAGTQAKANGAAYFGFGGFAAFGGSNPEDTNLISGNTHDGVGTNNGASLERNYMGVGANPKTAIPNGNPVDPFSAVIGLYGTPNRVVQNLIARNPVEAVRMYNPGVTYIARNRIYENAEIGLDLENNGVTPNDPLDADMGHNELQNFPKVQTAKRLTNSLKLKGVLNSEANGNYVVEFFEAKRKRREANRSLGSFGVTTDAEGRGTFSLTVGRRVKPGLFVTATATDTALGAEGGTSEFSKPRKVKLPN